MCSGLTQRSVALLLAMTSKAAGGLAAMAVALAVILVQRTSWWEYHYLLLSVPLGLLAASGIEALAPGLRALVPASPPKEVRVVVAAAAMLMFSVPLGSFGLKAAKRIGSRRLGIDFRQRA